MEQLLPILPFSPHSPEYMPWKGPDAGFCAPLCSRCPTSPSSAASCLGCRGEDGGGEAERGDAG